MLGQVFSTIGGFLGNLLGGGMISTVMRFAGRSLGGYLERSSNDPDEYYHTKYHLNNLHIHADTKGKPIPLVFGKARVAGHIMWATPIEEIAENSTDIKYFKDSDDVRVINHNTSYLYYANFALGICEGVVSDFCRIWVNGVETDLSEYNYRFYNGSEDQMPDPLIEKSLGPKITPAYRGLAYIVFEKLPLANFGGHIPNFSFEVIRKPNSLDVNSLEADIKSMVMIPGSGEFVYDTICQDKIVCAYPDDVELYREKINCHNKHNIANSIYSLNELQKTCPNLEWVAPVVSWFADSLDAGNANIFPAVEYKNLSTRTTEDWRVSNFTRDNARAVSRNKLDLPNYGGTVNDGSLVRYLKEIKRRGLKVMLYPMIFLDIEGKPWRGHITGDVDGVRYFFNHENGYKNFILHYAELTKGLVDAFIIGSEMKSLTKVRDGKNFPAVEELIDLARSVKGVLGPNVKVTYAADWSEYHHTDGGYYNLDPLWASEWIDFVGIDAYFPLTESRSSDIEIEDIKHGWKSGEGYEYYIDQASGQKHPLAPEWAWKNIEHWWKNNHFNPDRDKSPWIPKSKKIWFTEFGFPSIDKASNQPNVFFDPNCSDGGVPKYSSGEIDLAIQRNSIKATLDFWKDSEFVENIFLWTWDARPYPAWPHSDTWADGYMWHRGHWINGKLGVSNVASILLELCARAGIDSKSVSADTIDETITGMVLTKQSTIWDVISLMRLSYFFDIKNVNSNRIEFVKRGLSKPLFIGFENLVNNKNQIVQIIDIAEENSLSSLTISFPDENEQYHYNIVNCELERNSNRAQYSMNLPIIMDENTAHAIADNIIHSSRLENKIFQITLTIEYLMRISPGDVIILGIYNNEYKIRITDIKYEKMYLKIIGLFDYKGTKIKKRLVMSNTKTSDKTRYFEIVELPESLSMRYMSNIYVATSNKTSLYAIFNETIKVADLLESEMGILKSAKNNSAASDYVVDDISRFLIYSTMNFASALEYIPAIIGDELIYFKNIEKIENNLYEISSIIRGAKFTNISEHKAGERFVILKNASEIPVSETLLGCDIKFSAFEKEKVLNFKGISKKSLPVKNVQIDENGNISWQARLKNIDGWRDSRNELEYKIIHELKGSVEEFYTKKNNFLLQGISAESKVAIVAMQKGFAESEILYVLH